MGPSDPVEASRAAELFDIAENLFRYARRWVVGQAPTAEHVVIYDIIMNLLIDKSERLNRWVSKSPMASATTDRFIRRGPEQVTRGFTIPVTLEDSVVTLHRYARRYTNGRGTYTATIVNDAARRLLALGVRLDETKAMDGTIWAADGAGGAHDGLTSVEREEALASLPR